MATPDRLFNAEARAIDLMVWIDGVEVPFTDVEISFQLDQASRLAISIEPDEILELWRPKSRVHVWVRDPFPDKARAPFDKQSKPEEDQRDEDYDKHTYMLFWEGEVTSIDDTESADSRQTTITCQDYWNIPMKTDINLVDIGEGLKVAFINGSTFYGDAIDEGGDVVSNTVLFAMVNYLFKEGDKSFNPNQPSKIDSGVSEIGRQMLLYLAQFNASYGLQAWRTQMLEKFTGIPDKSMQSFMRYSLLPTMLGTAQQTQTSPDVYAFLMQIISKFFHHTMTVPLPPLKTELSGGGKSSIDTWGELGIIPNVYYAFAPLCNWLFPENYTQRATGRGFLEEPTRLGMSSVNSSIAGIRTIHLAPEGLISYLGKQTDPGPMLPDGADRLTLDRLHGGRQSTIPATSQKDISFNNRGFYLDPNVENKNDLVNLLKFLTPTELEKGIIYVESQNAYQEFLGLGRINSSTDDKNPALDTQAEVNAAIRSQARNQDAYMTFMRLLAQYELNFRQVSRHSQVTGLFNPWPVVGLPMMICREGRSYKGLLVGLSHRVSYGGGATTSYELAYTQLFRPKSLLDQGEGELAKAQAALAEAEEIQQGEYATLLAQLVGRNLISKEDAARLLESGIADIQATLNDLMDEAEAKEAADPESQGKRTAEVKAIFESRRQSVSSSLAEYGDTTFDLFDTYAGYVHGILDEKGDATKTTVRTTKGLSTRPEPDVYKPSLAEGSAVSEDVRKTLKDQVRSAAADSEGQGILKPTPWTGIEGEQVVGGTIFSLWSDCVRNLRLVFEELRALTEVYGTRISGATDFVLATSAAQDDYYRELRFDLNKGLAAANSDVKTAEGNRDALTATHTERLATLEPKLKTVEAEIQSNINTIAAAGEAAYTTAFSVAKGLGFSDENAASAGETARGVAEDLTKVIVDRLNSPKITQKTSLTDEINKLKVQIEDIKNFTQNNLDVVLIPSQEAIQAKIDSLPAVASWGWKIGMEDALRFFSRDDALTAAADTTVKPVFFADTGLFEPSPITWRSLFAIGAKGLDIGGAGAETGLARVKALVDAFNEAYEKFYETAPPTNLATVYGNLADDYKRATNFAFQTSFERLAEVAQPVMDKINASYSKFKVFLDEMSMELPPLMPFHNDSLTRLRSPRNSKTTLDDQTTNLEQDSGATFDDAIRGIVLPRSEVGKLGYWAEDLPELFSSSSVKTVNASTSLRNEIAFRYDEYVRMARKIFPFNDNDNDSEYRRQVDKGTPASWANSLQARQGVTLGEFLERTGLTLEQRSASDEDTFGKGTYYIAIAQATDEVQDPDLNSYFSKLGRISNATGMDPLGDSLREIREKAKAGIDNVNSGGAPEWQFLRASFRQDLIEQYTKKHAVARAFRGRR